MKLDYNTKIEIKENGDANFHFIETEKKDWLINIQLNGELTIEQQKEFLERIQICVNSFIGVKDPRPIIHQRISGNTTRLIDKTIQLLFQGDEILLLDHYKYGMARENFISRLFRRLEFEHNINFDNYLVFNKLKSTAKLKKEYFINREKMLYYE